MPIKPLEQSKLEQNQILQPEHKLKSQLILHHGRLVQNVLEFARGQANKQIDQQNGHEYYKHKEYDIVCPIFSPLACHSQFVYIVNVGQEKFAHFSAILQMISRVAKILVWN